MMSLVEPTVESDGRMRSAHVRQAAFAYLVVSAAMAAWQVGRTLVSDTGGVGEALARGALAGTLFFIVGMALLRGERWARWLGVRLGFGMAAIGLADPALELATGTSGSGALELLVELLPLPVVGAICGFAAWRLMSTAVKRELSGEPPEE